MRSTRILLTIVAVLLLATAAAAQTPDPACAADSLYLISPDAMEISLQTTGRLGMTISWEDLDLGEATCFVLRKTEGLGFTPVVTGGFGDRVDRLMGFTAVDSGAIGGASSNPLVIEWSSIGAATYGSLAGVLNLANNGGVYRYDAATGRWAQQNTGLPMSWRQTNVLALAEGSDGVSYIGLSGGTTLDTDAKGLYRNSGAGWGRVGEDFLGSGRRITAIAVDPTNSDRLAVGTKTAGLFVSTDGAQSFVQWTDQLDPTYPTPPPSYNVSAVTWTDGRLWVGVSNLGLFTSDDNGATFVRNSLQVPDDLDRGSPDLVDPLVNEVLVDPSDPTRILAALGFHGVYESNDRGATWHNLYGDLIVGHPGEPELAGTWVHTAQSVVIDPGDAQVLVMGVRQRGLFRTDDGGATWERVGNDQQPGNLGSLTRLKLTTVAGQAGRFVALEDNWSLLETFDGGLTWAPFSTQPTLVTGTTIVSARSGDGDLLMASWGGGIYVPGTAIEMADTYSSGTSTELRNLDLGLSITFAEGVVDDGDYFELVCQTFQGWAVWRGSNEDRDNMTMIGLYDRVNPEDCIEGYCGDLNFEPVPQCFAAKRAACFNFDTDDTIRFFDEEVYNGFNYVYAVTSFDYGNTAQTTPENNNKAMVVSPRWTGDELSPFFGNGNRTFVQVNLDAEPSERGQEIYVYPNPLRMDSGIPGEDGRTVVWTNLPPNSRIRVFTTAGDDVVNIGPENQSGGQMRWQTWNRNHEPVAAGVYLYKVIMPNREDYWGRLVIIR